MRRVLVIAGSGAFLISAELFAFHTLDKRMDRFAQGMATAFQNLDVAASAASAASKLVPQSTVQEQTDFGSDSELQRPIAVPPAALGALRNALKATPDQLPSDELKASEIHLAGPAETDLVVPRVAAHAAFFYILRPTASGYKLIFDSGGDTMTILRSRSHGYRDLEVWGFTQAGKSQTTVIYKFDGLRYVQFTEKTEHSS